MIERIMFDTLDDLPSLSRSSLAPLEADDPELFEELATSLVIEPASAPVVADLPAGVDEAPSIVDLSGKEIGAFRFAPVDGETGLDRIAAFDQSVREDHDVEGAITFIGVYEAGLVFVSPQGVGLLDAAAQPPRIRALAPDLARFLVVQANAYDAYKHPIVRAKDEAGYRAAAERWAALPAFAGVEVRTIFDSQLTA